MIGSALILALSVSTITNISYADEAIDVEKKIRTSYKRKSTR